MHIVIVTSWIVGVALTILGGFGYLFFFFCRLHWLEKKTQKARSRASAYTFFSYMAEALDELRYYTVRMELCAEMLKGGAVIICMLVLTS